MSYNSSVRNMLIIFLLSFYIWQPGLLTATESQADANYSLQETEQFMKNWYILGPIPVFKTKPDPDDIKTQRNSFEKDYLNPKKLKKIKLGKKQKVQGKEYTWQMLESKGDVFSFQSVFGDTDFVAAYAFAEINAPADETVLFGFGSDDGIRVWLNGKLIHDNWNSRPVRKDDDLVQLQLKKGSNQLLIKVQDIQLGWSFACRKIGSESVPEKMIISSMRGDMDNLKILLSNKFDVNAIIKPGITALHVAKIYGRKDVIDYLLKQGADEKIPMPGKDELVEALMNRIQKDNLPGYAILISKDGKIVYKKGFGYAELAHYTKITPQTKFRIGSVTKQFTAASILKLQEEGLINVNDKLSKYIPDFPRGNEVSIEHLLTHTSGIHSYTNEPDFLNRVLMNVTPKELVDTIKTFEYEFDPGEKIKYNNSGYFLLGVVIEKITNKTFAEYLKETFFGPLGMNNSGIHDCNTVLEKEATGYSIFGEKVQKALNWDMSHAGAAGAIYSTVEDLYLWSEALFNGKVISEKSIQKALTPAVLNDGSPATMEGDGYGYGIIISDFRGLRSVSHGGGLHGFLSHLERLPKKNFTIAVLHNASPTFEFSAGGLAREIIPIYLWEELDMQESFATNLDVDKGFFSLYAGRYEYPHQMIMKISVEKDQLFAQLTGQPKFEIYPHSDNEFFWKVVDAKIVFHKNNQGKITHAIHYQGGQKFKAPRLKEETVAKVNHTIYNNYIGEYKLAKKAIITVTKEKKKLFVQLTGQPRFEIFPRSNTEYFLKAVKADITFNKDKSGKVNGLTLLLDGVKQNAPKIK